MSISPKTAIVTGAAKRIGESIALYLARADFHVIVHYHHSQKDAENLALLIRTEGGSASVYQCDLADEKAVTWMIPNLHKDYPNLSVLINNASIFEPSGFLTSTNESLNRHFDINFKTPYILTREFAKVCAKGQVINLLDTDVIRARTEHFTYLLSKKALAELTLMAALELGPNIRVNGICPGMILPPAGRDENFLHKRAQGIPAKTHGNPAEIVKALNFLLNSEFVTGEMINVDGGEHLT